MYPLMAGVTDGKPGSLTPVERLAFVSADAQRGVTVVNSSACDPLRANWRGR